MYRWHQDFTIILLGQVNIYLKLTNDDYRLY